MNTSACLLLVEDDLDLQDTLRELLTDAGFEVVVICTGNEALDELDLHAANYEEVITDIDLGRGPDGWDVGRRAREHVADMPVVYMSGGKNSGDYATKGVSNSVFIMKPFAFCQMVKAHEAVQGRRLANLAEEQLAQISR